MARYNIELIITDSWNNADDRSGELSVGRSSGPSSLLTSVPHITFGAPHVEHPENIVSATLEIYVTTKPYYNIDTKASTINVVSEISDVTLCRNQYASFYRDDYNYLNLDFNTANELLQLKFAYYRHATDSSQSKIWLDFESSRQLHPPKLIVRYSDVHLLPYSTYPDMGFVPQTSPNKMTWGYYSDDAAAPLQPQYQRSEFSWRVKGAIAENKIITTNTEVIIPANTLPKGEFEWRVTITSSFGSNSSEWNTLTTIDSLSTARVVSPKSTYLAGNEPNLFKWQHIIPSGTVQTKAELQISDDNIQFTNLITVEGAALQITISPGKLRGGSLFWRVRTYNGDSIAGSWSESAPIMVYAAPLPPSVSTPGTAPCMTVRWQSTEQQAFRVRVNDWQSLPIFGTSKEYVPPLWLPDGKNKVAVQVQSSLGLWSEWSEVLPIIANVPQGKLVLSSRNVKNGAHLVWEGEQQQYIVYRDNIAILTTSKTEITDWLANGKHRYTVRGVNGGNYTMSNTITEITQCRTGVISDIDVIDWVVLKGKRGSSQGHNETATRSVNLQYFEGRTKPVAEVSDFTDAEHSLEYSFRDYADFEKVKRLLGKTVVYKDNLGTLLIGVITDISGSKDWAGTDISLRMVETDRKEGGPDYY